MACHCAALCVVKVNRNRKQMTNCGICLADSGAPTWSWLCPGAQRQYAERRRWCVWRWPPPEVATKEVVGTGASDCARAAAENKCLGKEEIGNEGSSAVLLGTAGRTQVGRQQRWWESEREGAGETEGRKGTGEQGDEGGAVVGLCDTACSCVVFESECCERGLFRAAVRCCVPSGSVLAAHVNRL